MVELVAKEIVRNLILVFLLVLVMFLAWDQSRAATVDLTIPPGDYMLVPVQPYTVVTIQSTPVDPPVLDTDGDGVNDDIDQCPDTPIGDEVDATGCTSVPPPVDSDGDGFADDIDVCPNDPGVDPDGCPLPPPLDADGDGVPDGVDGCPTEPAQTDDGCPIPAPPVIPDGTMIGAIAAAAPAQHATEIRFKKIADSEMPLSILPTTAEFPWCDDAHRCYKADEVFWQYGGGDWNLTDWTYVQPPGGGHSTTMVNAAYLGQLTITEGLLGIDWTRIIDPAPMINGDCGRPVDGPPAQHLYAGPQYVDATNEVFFPSGMGYYSACDDDVDRLDFHKSSGGWVIRKQSDGTYKYVQTFDPFEGDPPVFNVDRVISYARGCYLPSINKIIYSGEFMIDPADGYSWSKITPPPEIDGYWSGSGDFDVAADPASNTCYWYAKNRGIFGVQYDADANGVRTFRSVGDQYDVSSLEVEPISGNLLLIGRDALVKWIDVDTGEEWDISPTGGELLNSWRHLYGKTTLIPGAHCYGLTMHDGLDGVYVFTLPASHCSLSGEKIVPPPPAPPVSPAPLVEATIDPSYVPSAASFEEKCDREGVVFCDPLSDQPPRKIVDGEETVLVNPDGSQGIYFGKWWREWRGAEIYADGGFAEYDPDERALKITRLDSRGVKGGAYMTHFSDIAQENAFREGDTFQVEFQVKYPCETLFSDCDPASQTYKQNRIGPMGEDGGFQSRKMVILTEGNVLHGDDPDIKPATACQLSQIVVFNANGTFGSYNDCGRYTFHEVVADCDNPNFEHPEVCTAGQYQRQTGKDFDCWRIPYPFQDDPDDDGSKLRRMTWDFVSPTCAMIVADEWMTVRMHISVGNYNTDHNLFQLFVAYDGQPFKEVANLPITIRDPSPYPAYGSIHFTLHSTGSIADSGQPDQIVWYRDLIVSKIED